MIRWQDINQGCLPLLPTQVISLSAKKMLYAPRILQLIVWVTSLPRHRIIFLCQSTNFDIDQLNIRACSQYFYWPGQYRLIWTLVSNRSPEAQRGGKHEFGGLRKEQTALLPIGFVHLLRGASSWSNNAELIYPFHSIGEGCSEWVASSLQQQVEEGKCGESDSITIERVDHYAAFVFQMLKSQFACVCLSLWEYNKANYSCVEDNGVMIFNTYELEKSVGNSVCG